MAGVAFVGAPEIQHAFGISYSTAALVLFTIPTAVALVVEPPLFLWAERWDRHRTIALGIAVMGAALCGVGLSVGPVSLAVAMTAVFLGSGLGTSLAEAHLMDSNPEDREAVMARWTRMGVLGDLTAPLLLAALSALSLGWRWAAGGIGLGLIGYAALLWVRLGAVPESDEGDEEEPDLWTTIREALGNRGLLRWAFAAALCTLLDEVFMAFAALWIAASLPVSAAVRSGILAGFLVGGLIGLSALQRALERGVSPTRALLWCSAGCAVAFGLWMAAPSVGFSALGLVLLGCFTSSLWPLAQARTYAQLPGRAVVVEAVSGLFAPLDLLAPLVLGLIADRYGLEAALLLLLLQPLLLLGIALGDQSEAR